MRLYVAQYVICRKYEWFDQASCSVPIRAEKAYFIEAKLFAAIDPEQAYETAIDWMSGLDDAHHDGPGDLTSFDAIGLHNIEKVDIDLEQLQEEAVERYGVGVGIYGPDGFDAHGVPMVREKAALEIFRGADT